MGDLRDWPVKATDPTAGPSPGDRLREEATVLASDGDIVGRLLMAKGYMVIVRDPHRIYPPKAEEPIAAVEVVVMNPNQQQGQPLIAMLTFRDRADFLRQMEMMPAAALQGRIVIPGRTPQM